MTNAGQSLAVQLGILRLSQPTLEVSGTNDFWRSRPHKTSWRSPSISKVSDFYLSLCKRLWPCALEVQVHALLVRRVHWHSGGILQHSFVLTGTVHKVQLWIWRKVVPYSASQRFGQQMGQYWHSFVPCLGSLPAWLFTIVVLRAQDRWWRFLSLSSCSKFPSCSVCSTNSRDLSPRSSAYCRTGPSTLQTVLALQA